eukprot:GEMP01017888.1.p1 GENE.GEMP01017888.1~~GEMP01017888.1.p1  ORF type:complete len:515 (+),score=99.84 GEMP01017888.1:336-1880(+)
MPKRNVLPNDFSPGSDDRKNLRDDKLLDDTPLRRKKLRSSVRRSALERSIRSINEDAHSPPALDSPHARSPQSPNMLLVPGGASPASPHEDPASDATPGSSPAKSPKKLITKVLPSYNSARFYPVKDNCYPSAVKPSSPVPQIKSLQPPKKISSKIANPYDSEDFPSGKARRSKTKLSSELSPEKRKSSRKKRKSEVGTSDLSVPLASELTKSRTKANSMIVNPDGAAALSPDKKVSKLSKKTKTEHANSPDPSSLDSPRPSATSQKEEKGETASPSADGLRKSILKTSLSYWKLPTKPQPKVSPASAMQVIKNTLRSPLNRKNANETQTAKEKAEHAEKAEKRRALKNALVDEIIGKLEKKVEKEENAGGAGQDKKLKKLKKKLKKERAEKERLKAEAEAAQLTAARSEIDAATALAVQNSMAWKKSRRNMNVILIGSCLLFWLTVLGVILVFFVIKNADGCTSPQTQCCDIISNCNIFCTKKDTLHQGCFGFFSNHESAHSACTGICSAPPR